VKKVDETRCPECDTWYETKKGKTYCSRKCQKKAGGRRHDSRRIPQQSEKGVKFRLSHPEYDRERMRRNREKYGPTYSHMLKALEEAMMPIDVEIDACIVAGDVHVPFHDEGMFNWVLDVQQDCGIKNLFIPGDFLDADAYSKWPSLPGVGVAFKTELEYAGMVLSILGDAFEKIYICRGNHENRIINTNNANLNMVELMQLCKAPENVIVTNDTFMRFKVGEHQWQCSHPDQFWQTPGQLSKALAEKYDVNHISAHGHFFGEYRTKSGKLYALDGGGLFDSRAMAYQRRVRTLPKTQNGFWMIDEDGPTPFTLGAW